MRISDWSSDVCSSDLTIAVAMPTISGDLGVSTTEGTWIITAYAAAEAITVPLTGWLARRFGEVRLFVMCVIGFVACSVLCGLSHSLGLLVAFPIGRESGRDRGVPDV